MGAPAPQLFDDLFTYVDAATAKYFLDGAEKVTGAMHNTVSTMLILYVTLWGLATWRGMIKEPIMDGTMRVIKIVLITTFANNASEYTSGVATFLYEWPPALAGVLMGTTATTTTQLIDQCAASGLDLASKAWETASITNLGGYVVGITIFAITLVVALIAASIIIGSKFGLSILLALGPIFILMLLFDYTRHYFDKWLGLVVTSGFAIVMTSMATDLLFKYFGASFDAASAHVASNGGIVSLGDIAPAVVAGGIAAFFILNIPHLAAGLGGGASAASASAAGWAHRTLGNARMPQRNKSGKNKEERIAPGQKRQGGNIQRAGSGVPQAAYRRITRQAKRPA